jgi:CPA1 family monovalent cation:H+ antiporter
MLAAAGVILGLVPGLFKRENFTDLILVAFVPGLIFEASLTLNLPELRRMLIPVSLLATFGVGLTVLCIGALAHYVIGFSWANAMLLGAILAATDPIAVITLLRQLKAPRRLAAILEGESLFNDGTGVAIFAAVLGSILAGTPSPADASWRFFLLTGGGIVVGILVGAVGVLIVRGTDEAQLEILATLAIAYGSYLAADVLHFSGIVAVVCAGIVVARYGSATGRLRGTQLLGFWNLLAFVLNAILFLLVGTVVPTAEVVAVGFEVLIAYAIMFATRAVPTYLLLAIADPRATRIPWPWRHLTFWGGLRGALGVALALSVAGLRGVAADVSVVAYGVILLSLIIQGGLIVPVTRALAVGQEP